MKQDPRTIARKLIRESISTSEWTKNGQIVTQIQTYIGSHRLLKHPLIDAMNATAMDSKAIQMFHLEFGYAFAQIFTDTLLRSMVTCEQLEKRAGAIGKFAPRFLLQLNMLDELGFLPGEDGENHRGTPLDAHYVKFSKTLEEIGLTPEMIQSYEPSPFARACRHTFEECYGDHLLLTAVLACAESCFSKFAGPWARNTGAKTDAQIEQGYHAIHVEDEHGGIDDDHSADMWLVLQQALVADRHDEIIRKSKQWVNCWTHFADALFSQGKS